MTEDKEWDNHARQLQAEVVAFHIKHRISAIWIEGWIAGFLETGIRRLKRHRDLANIFIEYQEKNHVSDEDMDSLLGWLCDEAMLFNIQETERKNK